MSAQTSSHTAIALALLAGLGIGFTAGYLVGRQQGPDSGQIPCPPCHRYTQSVLGQEDKCWLFGRISPDWEGGPVYIPAPLGLGDDQLYDRGDCIKVEVKCNNDRDLVPSLQFQSPAGTSDLTPPIANPWCLGPACHGDVAEACPNLFNP